MVRAVRRATRLPLAVQLSPYFSPLTNMAGQLVEAGANGQVCDWMDGHGFETVDQLQGRLSQRSVPSPGAFERANYIKTLASHSAPGGGCLRYPRTGRGLVRA